MSDPGMTAPLSRSDEDPAPNPLPEAPLVSVVLDPVGWIEGTLTTIATQARRAFGNIPGEIIVATGEGVETDDVEFECRSAGIRHVPFTAEHHRASALNNAAAAAEGEYLLLLDEDFMLADGAIGAAVDGMSRASADVVQLECRDAQLPGAQNIHDLDGISPRRYLESVPRARANRGTAALLRRQDFLRIRGFDERPSLGPHLCMDLLARTARAGLVLDWLTGPQVTAYHVFGLTCGDIKRHGTESARARSAHHDIVEDDRTIYRNLASWSVPHQRREVLVSVAISTRNRSEYLEDSIDSVLAQTFPDFELIVVDDGSTDDTRRIVEGYADPRVIYVHQEPAGISAGRNRAADLSRGHFTAVHDDDDIMMPWRLEVSLQNIVDEYCASYGSWVNFDNLSGEMVLHVIRREFSPELNAFNGQGPGHATWLLPTQAIREVRYDEHLSSSVDHNLASRLAWSGLRWKHTERVMYLRRIHPTQVSAVDGGRQRTTSVLTRFANRFATSEPGRQLMVEQGSALTNPDIPERSNLFKAFGAYLPDHLVHRTLVLANNITNKVIDLDLYQKVGCVLAEHDLHTGRLRLEMGELPGISWKDLVTLRDSGVIGVRLEATAKPPAAAFDPLGLGAPRPKRALEDIALDRNMDRARELVMERLAYHYSVLRKKSPTSLWLIAKDDALEDDELAVLKEATRAYDIRASGDHGTRFGVFAFGYEQSAAAMSLITQLEEAITSGRLLIADAEQQPSVHIAELLADTQRPLEVGL